MLKFIRGKGQQPSAERQKLQNELFAFRKTVQHGFPHRASALAWDPLLRLAALGTASGALKVYGRPGVELYGQHTNPDAAVTAIHFIPGTGRLISLCDDNSLHLWEITEKSLVELKSHLLEGKNKKVSTLCVESSGKNVLLGTEGGNIYTMDLNTFAINEDVIYQEVVMQNCPEDFKVNPGAVEAVCEHPKTPARILIGYSRGLVVLWDRANSAPTHTFVSNQQLESLCWNDDGDHFTSSHNDGSYVTWEVGGGASDRPLKEPVTPYGPYPCKAITKILNRTSVTGEEITIYAGGMPRASYSDKYTVTVQQGEKHVAFDFTSRVIDFFTTSAVPPDGAPLQEERPDTPAQLFAQTVNQVAAALVVLAEEELVVIDLCDSRWRPLRLPYLVSIHASAVTTAQLVDNVASNVYDNIVAAGQQQTENIYSPGAWPISGGVLCGADAPAERQLLLTGHEDGSVRFWDVTGVPMTPLYKYTTAQLFSGLKRSSPSGEEIGETNDSQTDEEEWPPFKRVGTFDPYSDDPRLAVKRVILCPLSGMLTIGGAAGHIVIASLKASTNTAEIKSVSVNIVSDRDGFVWKGHDQLTLRAGTLTFPQGYQATSVVQLSPPAAVTALAAQWEWGVVCAGTAHGLCALDAIQARSLAVKCTLNPHGMSCVSSYSTELSPRSGSGGWCARARRTGCARSTPYRRARSPSSARSTRTVCRVSHLTVQNCHRAVGVGGGVRGHGARAVRARRHTGALARRQVHAQPARYVVCLILQYRTVTAQWEWGVVCAGTAHGLCALDAIQARSLAVKCTLNPHDHSGAGDTPISRRKSFKKSLRESFRRLRKGRSQRRATATSPASPAQPAKKPIPSPVEEADVKPVERAVEARSNDDGFGSMVRCLYFARTFLINTQSSTPTLWAGTNNGTVYAFTLSIPNTNKRKDEQVTCTLAKEIQLKHRAPVIGITVLDGAAVPLPDPLEVERGVASLPEPGTHRVCITSEEQFKVFTLPSLKPHHKYKLTAHEGARVRRTAFAWFECSGPGGAAHREWCLLCLTNLGDCLVLSPELRRQLNAAAVRKEDINGISSLCFSKRGEALYLHSSSELQRITLSATKVTIAQCQVLLAPWAVELRGPADEAPLTNGEHKEEAVEAPHDVTAASADITVDSVRDHTAQPEPELNINLQNSQVNTSSMVVKTTTRTAVNENNAENNGTATTTTTTTTVTENILEHNREEGVITRIETGTVTVPAGTDPKLILEMFDRQREPLAVPVAPAGADTN
ncbi:lethal(2) giant larvae protein homolog 1 isoform X2 [Cydia pomonella]|nr:lethal(2) giant larvae protein homolog 1 isoform X2 [Cydia pomonella]XP_061713708.1 lethal(2) giant larvae protein homolog 1 isoform X2 [Cydia pomonella]